MKITKVLPYLVVALLVFFSITNDTISSALINFLMAGIVPGTSVQLPWYAVLVLVPLLLFGVWQLIRSLDFVPKDWVAPEKTTKKAAVSKKRLNSSRRPKNTHAAKKKRTRSKSTRSRAKKLSALTQT